MCQVISHANGAGWQYCRIRSLSSPRPVPWTAVAPQTGMSGALQHLFLSVRCKHVALLPARHSLALVAIRQCWLPRAHVSLTLCRQCTFLSFHHSSKSPMLTG